MIQSKLLFRKENDRLKVCDEFFEQVKSPNFRVYNKIVGFFLWIFGKAQFIEDRYAKFWFINKNSYEKCLDNYIPGQHFNNIDDLVEAVKQQSQQQKDAKEQKNKEEKVQKNELEYRNELEPEIPLKKKQENENVHEEKVLNAENIEEIKQKNENVHEVEVLNAENIEEVKQKIVEPLFQKEAQSYVENAPNHSIPWDDEILILLQHLETLPVIKFQSRPPIAKIKQLKNLKNIEINFLHFDHQELKDYRQFRDMFEFCTLEIDFIFKEKPSEQFYRLMAANKNDGEHFIHFILKNHNETVEILYDLLKILKPLDDLKEDDLWELFSLCLEKLASKNEFDEKYIQSLKAENQRKLFKCCLNIHNRDRDEHIRKILDALKDEPKKLFNFIKSFQKNREFFDDENLNSYKIFLQGLTTSGAFEEEFLKTLSQAEQSLFIEFIKSEFFIPFLNKLDKKENWSFMEKLFQGCIYLIYHVNNDPDLGVNFIDILKSNKTFARFFLSLTKDHMLAIEKCFREFKDIKSCPYLDKNNQLLKGGLTEKIRLETGFLEIISNFIYLYIGENQKDFNLIKEKIDHLTKNLPWITPFALHLVNIKLWPAVLSYFITSHVLNSFENNKDLDTIYSEIGSSYRTLGDYINKVTVSLLFKHTPKERQGDLLFLFRQTDMLKSYFYLVFSSYDNALHTAVFKNFFKINKNLLGSPLEALSVLIVNIITKNDLVSLLKIIKELPEAEQTDYLKNISEGVMYNNKLHKVILTDEQVKEAFEEANVKGEG